MLSIGSMALLAILCTGIAASTAWAEEEKPTADLSVSALSKYVWRGFELSKDSIVLQPSMTVGYKGFGFNLWGNLDTDQHEFVAVENENSSSWTETDMTLSYDASCSFADYGVGYIYYAVEGYPNTQEIYASATLKTLLSPSLTIYRDYDALPGWYLTVGISHSFAINEQLSLDLGAKIGYLYADDASSYAEQNKDANGEWIDQSTVPNADAFRDFHDGQLSASMTFPVGEYFSVTPEIYYSFPLTSEAQDLIESGSANGKDSDFVYGGVTLSMSF
jgi:hypothetical protein